MNGSTTESITCEATSRVLMPWRPTAMATTMDGTKLIHRVINLRKKGYTIEAGNGY